MTSADCCMDCMWLRLQIISSDWHLRIAILSWCETHWIAIVSRNLFVVLSGIVSLQRNRNGGLSPCLNIRFDCNSASEIAGRIAIAKNAGSDWLNWSTSVDLNRHRDQKYMEISPEDGNNICKKLKFVNLKYQRIQKFWCFVWKNFVKITNPHLTY